MDLEFTVSYHLVIYFSCFYERLWDSGVSGLRVLSFRVLRI